MANFKIITLLFVSVCLASTATSVELVIGEQRIEPGIMFVFEGAVKDQVVPASFHLPEEETNVHLEARVNWDSDNIPALPGDIGDLYSVSFAVARLSPDVVALHKDWLEAHGTQIVEERVFEYAGVDFSEIANASR